MIYLNEERREFLVFLDKIELEFVFVVVGGKYLFCVDMEVFFLIMLLEIVKKFLCLFELLILFIFMLCLFMFYFGFFVVLLEMLLVFFVVFCFLINLELLLFVDFVCI